MVGVLRTQPHTAAAAVSLAHAQTSLRRDVARLATAPQGNKPVTLGIGEPFTTTVTISFVFALIVSLPFVLYQRHLKIRDARAREAAEKGKLYTSGPRAQHPHTSRNGSSLPDGRAIPPQ